MTNGRWTARSILATVGLAAVITACGGSSGSPATSSTAPTTTIPPTTTVTTVTTTSAPPGTTTTQTPTTTSPTPTTTTTSTSGPPSGKIVLGLPSVGEFGSGWVQLLFIPYGEAEDRLGTAPGGEAGSLDLGPDYGAQAPDGTWWFLDVAKRRFAHYSQDGAFIDAIAMRPEYMVNGQYFQYQLPRFLDDGTLVASKLGFDNSSSLFLLDAGSARVVNVPVNFGVRTDDGTTLYGFSGEDQSMTAVDPVTGDAETVDWFLTRAGTRYRLTKQGNALQVELPDAPGGATLSFELAYAEDLSIPAYGLVEVASGEDGSLFLYIIGGTDTGEGGQLAGFLSISPAGVPTPVESTRNPFSPSDPGSPGQLGMKPGTSLPWLMFIDTDGVRIFTPVS